MKRSRIVLAFLVLLALTGASCVQAREVPRISKEEVLKMVGNPDAIIIDVRSESDWIASKAKIKGALREDPGELSSWADKYPKDRTLVLY